MSDTSNTKKIKNIEEVNILRGMLCVFVLIIHTTANPSIQLEPMSVSSIVFSVLNIATKIAVPGFIFISGLTIAYSYKDRKIGKLSSFYKKRFKGVLIPYIIWTLIYYGVYIIFYNYEISIVFLIKKLMDGSMSYHLYFLVIIIQLYIIFPIVLYLFKKYDTHFLLILFIIINLLMYNFSTSSVFLGKYIAFFTTGMYVGLNYDNVIKILNTKKYSIIFVSLGIIMTIYYIVEEYLFRYKGIALYNTIITWYIFSIVCMPMYYTISIKINNSNKIIISKFKNILNDISSVSFSIYLVHPLVIIVLEKILSKLSISWKYTIMTVGLPIIAISYSKIIKKLIRINWGNGQK